VEVAEAAVVDVDTVVVVVVELVKMAWVGVVVKEPMIT